MKSKYKQQSYNPGYIEIEYYSVAYYERITKFDALWRWTSAKGETHTRYVNLMRPRSAYEPHPYNGILGT